MSSSERADGRRNITKGWSVSGITTLASGLPITIEENDDNSLTGTNTDLPNYNYAGGKLEVNHNQGGRLLTSILSCSLQSHLDSSEVQGDASSMDLVSTTPTLRF